MAKRVSATNAKNNFGGLLDDVAVHGRVEIVRHGRLVAVVLAPREVEARESSARARPSASSPGRKRPSRTHMIPPELARRARLVRVPLGFDDD